MDDLNEILKLLKLYLAKNTANVGFWHLSSFKDLLPIVQAVGIIGAAIAGFVKYINTKNKEIYEKILNEVYAPLYMRIVKQEYIRKLYLKTTPVEEATILSITKTEQRSKIGNTAANLISEPETKVSSFINKNNFIDVMKGINSGLASQKLLTLMACYESSIYISNESSKESNGYYENEIIKEHIELEIYEEIIKGYQYYYKKLGLDKNNNNKDNNWEIAKNRLIIKYKADPEKVNKFKQDYERNSEKYK